MLCCLRVALVRRFAALAGKCLPSLVDDGCRDAEVLAECGCAVVVEWVIVAFSSVKLFEVRGMRFAVEAPDGAFDDFSQDEALQKEAVGAIVCDGGLAVGGVVDGVVDEVEGIGFWVWLVGDGVAVWGDRAGVVGHVGGGAFGFALGVER